jgi:ABC-type arginine/histidine transport system permease subunit
MKTFARSEISQNNGLLGTFVKLWKATIGFVISVCLSVRMEQLGSHWTDFHEILYVTIFRKSIEKIQVLLKLDKNSGYFTWRPIYIFDHISVISS